MSDVPLPPRPSFDEYAGDLVRQARHEKGMSQADLAAGMSQHGVPTHQQTVLKIEQGSRPMRLAEAVAIADVLGLSLDNYFRATPIEEVLLEAAEELRNAQDSVREAVAAFLQRWEHAKDAFDFWSERLQQEGSQITWESEVLAGDPDDYLHALAESIALAEWDRRRSKIAESKEEADALLSEQDQRTEAIYVRLLEKADGEHPEAP